jgi:hypothetical protein
MLYNQNHFAMKKIFIASLVGAIIMFVWSFLAWMVTPIHENTYKYTPAQDAIMKVLAENNLETGVYGMPSAATKKEAMKIMESNKGKPGVAIHYIKEDPGMGGSQMVWGFIFDFIMVFAACTLLINNMSGSFFSRWWMVMMFAVVVIFGVYMMQWNWMGYTWNYTRDFVLDCVIGWALNGLWLGWYLGKR